MDSATQLIGVDIGGSGARAAALEKDEEGGLFMEELHELSWDDGFDPVPIKEQLAYPGEVTAAEEVFASDRLARLVELIAACAEPGSIFCGVAVPGLLTEDGSGVIAWRNGPRRSTLASDLQRALQVKGFVLDAPLSLCPDSVAAALGEHRARGGALRDITNGLCISGGSGVGEAAIVEGRCLALNELDPPLARAWELPGGEGSSLEDRVAPGRVLKAWQSAGGVGLPEADEGVEASALLDARDDGVMSLIQRARSWFDSQGLALERVALSQTLGHLYSEDAVRFDRITGSLGELELVTSSLRGAPLLGAALHAEVERP